MTNHEDQGAHITPKAHILPLVVEQICAKNPFQKKMIQKFLSDRNELYWDRFRIFEDTYLRFLTSIGVTLETMAASYLRLCEDMLHEQILFKKTGRYSSPSLGVTNRTLYSQRDRMSSLLYGLGLSQFLWPNHYALFDFFISRCRQLSQVSSYLEVGPGHGLFLLEALRIFQDVEAMAIDISPTAIHISQSAVETLLPRSKCRFLIQDINQLEYGTYDLICMCELLEHLDDPIPVLRKALSLLAPQGHCFITTCANAPAIDHVYLYDSVEAIQSQLIDCGFRIEVELALPVESIPRERWSSEKTEVNYGALLSKQI